MGEKRPRGTLPDAVKNGDVYLIKMVSNLRATYQVRLCAFMASNAGRKLYLLVPGSCQGGDILAADVANAAEDLERNGTAREQPVGLGSAHLEGAHQIDRFAPAFVGRRAKQRMLAGCLRP